MFSAAEIGKATHSKQAILLELDTPDRSPKQIHRARMENVRRAEMHQSSVSDKNAGRDRRILRVVRTSALRSCRTDGPTSCPSVLSVGDRSLRYSAGASHQR